LPIKTPAGSEADAAIVVGATEVVGVEMVVSVAAVVDDEAATIVEVVVGTVVAAASSVVVGPPVAPHAATSSRADAPARTFIARERYAPPLRFRQAVTLGVA
jgi:hypothetical protein